MRFSILLRRRERGVVNGGGKRIEEVVVRSDYYIMH